ncbi:MAG: cbb3-type cytochrome oxidase assembly protein CcoS [Acetobacteraceae bacterium]
MTVILYLLGASLFLGGIALTIFMWSLRSGQFEDLEGAANRILFDDDDRSPGPPVRRMPPVRPEQPHRQRPSH